MSFSLFYLFLERMEGKEREKTSICERNTDWLPLPHPKPGTTQDLSCNPGMNPDQESNQRPFALQDDTQTNEPHWSGQEYPYS